MVLCGFSAERFSQSPSGFKRLERNMDACGSIGSDRVRRRSAVDKPRVDRGVVVKIHIGIESEDLVGQFEDGGSAVLITAPRVVQVTNMWLSLAVNADSGIKTINELMAAAKANPGKYNYATHGALSTQRLFMSRLLKAFPGVDLPHVSYTSGHEVSTALLGRHVTSGFGVTTNQKPYVLSGDFTMIGVSSPERLAEFPDVPTFAEQIGPEYTFASSHGLVAPKRVPEDRILTMQNLVKEALADPDVQAKFAKAGLTTDYLSAEDFQKALDNMWKTIGDIMRENKFN